MLKGGASSVGAEILRKLSEKAQMMERATHPERTAILNQIEAAYQQVKRRLIDLGY